MATAAQTTTSARSAGFFIQGATPMRNYTSKNAQSYTFSWGAYHTCWLYAATVTAIKDVLDGFYDADGKLPCQIDGGLKCFGHPIGASGLRMIYEMYLQLQGRAGERQRKVEPIFGLTHNLGGMPMRNVAAISIIGKQGA